MEVNNVFILTWIACKASTSFIVPSASKQLNEIKYNQRWAERGSFSAELNKSKFMEREAALFFQER